MHIALKYIDFGGAKMDPNPHTFLQQMPLKMNPFLYFSNKFTEKIEIVEFFAKKVHIALKYIDFRGAKMGPNPHTFLQQMPLKMNPFYIFQKKKHKNSNL